MLQESGRKWQEKTWKKALTKILQDEQKWAKNERKGKVLKYPNMQNTENFLKLSLARTFIIHG